MNGAELVVQMRDLQNRLNASLGEFGKWGKNLAKAEYDYDVAYAKALLVEKEKGTAATILKEVCRGRGDIAKARLNRNTAEVMYKAAAEHINAIKLEMRVIQDAIEREWRSA